jgi:hypothetical protein
MSTSFKLKRTITQNPIFAKRAKVCQGCVEQQGNQLAHMDEGGCLYNSPTDSDTEPKQCDLTEKPIIEELKTDSPIEVNIKAPDQANNEDIKDDAQACLTGVRAPNFLNKSLNKNNNEEATSGLSFDTTFSKSRKERVNKNRSEGCTTASEGFSEKNEDDDV